MRPRGGRRLDAVFLSVGAVGGEWAGRALRLLFPAILAGNDADAIGEQSALGLGNEMLQAGAGFGLVLFVLDQPQTSGATQSRRVHGDGMSAQRALHHPGDDIIIGRLVTCELLGRLLHTFLLQLVQIERKVDLEDFLQERDEPLRSHFRVAHAGESFLQLAERADADLVPIEELLAQVTIRLIGLFARGVLAAETVDKLLQHRAFFLIHLDGLLGGGEKVGEQPLFINGGRHGYVNHSLNGMANGRRKPAGMSLHQPAYAGRSPGGSSASPSAVPSGGADAGESVAFGSAGGGADSARASLIKRVISMLFFTPWSSTKCRVGVKRVCKRRASFDWTNPAA